MPKQIAVYGGGGFAREVAWLVESCSVGDQNYQVVCFIEDDEAKQGKLLNEIPTLSLANAYTLFPEACVVSGIGSPQLRENTMQKAAEQGFSFATFIHPRTEKSRWIEIGEGAVICAGNILTTNITIGDHVQINLDCTIGHDVVLGDYTTLAPGVHISGCVHLGKRVYMGTGATVINGTQDAPIVIVDDVIVGAGACVTKSVLSAQTIVGVPAKPLLRS